MHYEKISKIEKLKYKHFSLEKTNEPTKEGF